MICNCAAPLDHHKQCALPAAAPSSLCEVCQLCWELAGPCCAPDVPEVEAPKVEAAADAPSVEEQLGI